MKKFAVVFSCIIFISIASNAQYRRPMGRRMYPRQVQRNLPEFKPSLSLSFGYGWPNLDKDQFVQYYNYYQGKPTDNGLIHGSLDYRFSRTASLGIQVSHGKTSTSYYDFNNPSVPVINGSLESWSVMLNMVRYLADTKIVSPYIRTAIGANFWTQNYADENGNQLLYPTPSVLAYQTSIGAKFHLNNDIGLFVEAGYGKYILSGGLTIKL